MKFLKYASRDVVAVLQRLEPYEHIGKGNIAFLLGHPAEPVAIHARLVNSSELHQQTAAACLEPLLKNEVDQPMPATPGWQAMGPHHWRLDVQTPAELQRAVGVEALRQGASQAFNPHIPQPGLGE